MFAHSDDDVTQYQVVRNAEEQYSIWPDDRPPPQGWEPTGRIGLRAECLAYIEAVWTDLRPASLRRAMDVGRRAD